MNTYLTTELQTQNEHYLNTAANLMLSPVRYFCGGRHIQILDGRVIASQLPEPNDTVLKTAAVIAAFIPGLILGIILRGCSYVHTDVRAAFILIEDDAIAKAQAAIEAIFCRSQNTKPPQIKAAVSAIAEDLSKLPLETVVDKDIAFFQELLSIPDDALKTWLEDKVSDKTYINPFHSASVLEESKMVFEEHSSAYLTELLGLFEKATQRLQKLGLFNSVTESAKSEQSTVVAVSASSPKSAQEPPKALPKEDKPLSNNTLQLLAKLKNALNESEFALVCAKYKQNPVVVTEKINALNSARTIRAGIENAVAFLLELRDDIKDKEVANWIKKQKTAKNYAYPFYYGELVSNRKNEFKKIADKQLVDELSEFYPVAKSRLIKLGLAELLNEKPSSL